MAKSVVVTGAAGGIGRAAAERFARGGWRVLAVDRAAVELSGVATLAADVSSEEDNRRIAAEAERLFGGLDALVLNAGVTGGGSIDSLSFADYQRVIGINLFGPILGIKAMLPLLRKRENAAIVVTSSTMGVAGDADNSAYCISKHGVIGLIRSLSRELGWEGIRINALCPGPTQTGMTGTAETMPAQIYEHLKRSVPLQRWAQADEMASVIEFLVSPAASFVSGHAMVADGGAMVGTGLVAPKAGPKP